MKLANCCTLILVLGVYQSNAQTFTPYGKTDQQGVAMFYADYLQGQATAYGETYQRDQLTAAHPTHPKGTLLRISNLTNYKSTVIRVNDRGPFCDGCVVQVSKAAAIELDMIKSGKAQVKITVVGYSEQNPQAARSLAGRVNTTGVPSSYEESSGERINRQDGIGYLPPNTYNSRSEELPASYDSRAASSQRDQQLTARGVGNAVAVSSSSDIPTIPSGTTGYAIQLSSYSDLDNARRQVAGLQGRGVDYLHLFEATARDGSPLYRVVIGPFVDKTAARNHMAKVANDHALEGLVIGLR